MLKAIPLVLNIISASSLSNVLPDMDHKDGSVYRFKIKATKQERRLLNLKVCQLIRFPNDGSLNKRRANSKAPISMKIHKGNGQISKLSKE